MHGIGFPGRAWEPVKSLGQDEKLTFWRRWLWESGDEPGVAVKFLISWPSTNCHIGLVAELWRRRLVGDRFWRKADSDDKGLRRACSARW